MRTRLTVLMIVVGLALAACGGGESTDTTPTAPEDQAEPWTESDLVYATRIRDGVSVALDMHFPADPDDAPIVFEAPPSLIEEGMIVVTWNDDDSLGEGPGGPEEIVADRGFVRGMDELLGCAIRLARARASELGSADPMVVLTGVSAGGGRAAQVALFGDTLDARWDEFAAAGGPSRQFDCEVPDGSTDVDVVVGMAGTYDLSMPIFDGTYGRTFQQEHDPEMQEFLASAIGANPDLKVRLIHGTHDDIPVEYANEFAERLSDAGYDAQLFTWAGGHEAAPRELLLSTLVDVLGS